ncbi:hypothetical protein Pla22_08460 [Rubripirellula amarantea]|uniref:Uncharacterized protein n=1 Tax=Rubripirellula amarantea TaxID=2527999 RepID=A0A5C5WRL3_9BACT|nr:hypothetical protein Pla22_08460 [Rubripirellula amarantea]
MRWETPSAFNGERVEEYDFHDLPSTDGDGQKWKFSHRLEINHRSSTANPSRNALLSRRIFVGSFVATHHTAAETRLRGNLSASLGADGLEVGANLAT